MIPIKGSQKLCDRSIRSDCEQKGKLQHLGTASSPYQVGSKRGRNARRKEGGSCSE